VWAGTEGIISIHKLTILMDDYDANISVLY